MLEKFKQELEVICNNHGLELYDLSYVKEGQENILRILIDNEDGIDLDTLVKINELVSTLLDELDPIKELYMLEVSSPGAERPINNEDQLRKAIGRFVFVKTFDQDYLGDLLDYKDGNLVLNINLKGRFKKVEVPYVDVQSMRLSVKF